MSTHHLPIAKTGITATKIGQEIMLIKAGVSTSAWTAGLGTQKGRGVASPGLKALETAQSRSQES